MAWHETQRAALAAALTEHDPDAPTLCEGWQARHLAAHVLLRERSPWLAAALVTPGLRGRAQRHFEAVAAVDDAGYRELVARFATPPPAWSPWSWAGEQINTVEYFVHTEDVRRGAGDVVPRDLEHGLERALWGRLTQAARLAYRRSPAGVVLAVPGGPRREVRRPRAGHGSVVVSGRPGELLLHAFGRGARADVTLDGAPADVDALRAVAPA
ncbi:TIGR03085 family metal-binding protein [Oerskovia flava]|uniref:TIGR03085 family metal-binding protein n=1 Tax=Oerskovia flava TaxID=2986422 RepID=UPI00223ED822|nr:TIGR03085 family metal-binding protein [Oerskovia sp. JB1-3-2]